MSTMDEVVTTTDGWIITNTGRKFWPLQPRVGDVDIRDIAHSLAMKCRYGGHCSKFYSVAQHSVHVSHVVPLEHALWGLLHDASEAYLADVPRPVKPHLPGFKDAEANVMAAICEKFGLSPDEPPEVKAADHALLWDEMVALMPSANLERGDIKAGTGLVISAWRWEDAKSLFMNRFYDLTEVK